MKVKTTMLLLVFGLGSPVAWSLCDAACTSRTGSGSHHHHAVAKPMVEQPPAAGMGHHHDHMAQTSRILVPPPQLSGVNKNCAAPDDAAVASAGTGNRVQPSPTRTTAPLAAIADEGVSVLLSASGSPPDTAPRVVTSLRI